MVWRNSGCPQRVLNLGGHSARGLSLEIVATCEQCYWYSDADLGVLLSTGGLSLKPPEHGILSTGYTT